MPQRQRSTDSMPRAIRVMSIAAALLFAAEACVPDPPSSPGDTLGSIVASVATTGPDAPASYSLTLDGGAPQTVGANASRSFTGLTSGSHAVALTAVPANCTVAGQNPRQVAVAEGADVETAFVVTCTEAARGDLQVTTTAAGQDVDPDGYTVLIDGGGGQSIDTNATRTFSNLLTGGHTVELTGIAANCAVDGNNPRTVNVPADQTATTTFAVVCVTTRGDIIVTVTSVGVSFDSDGYQVDLDDVRKQPVAGNGMTTFTSVLEGTHILRLEDVEGGCTVSSENPLTVEVVAGEATAAAFDVECII